MNDALIIHGCCDEAEFFSNATSCSHSHWIPWAQQQLLVRGFQVQTPEMPKPYAPQFVDWKRMLEAFNISTRTSLVGYSCGAGFLLRWLTETKTRIDRLVLVAPWIDPLQTRGTFLNFSLDGSITEGLRSFHLIYSRDDVTEGAKESIELLRNTFPTATLHEVQGKGHFTIEDMGTCELPELLGAFDQD